MEHHSAHRSGPSWVGRRRVALALTLALVASTMFALLPSAAADEAPNFPDVAADATHVNGITWLAEEGITTGFTDGTFRPGSLVTRGQIASFLDRALDLEVGGDPGFTDVSLDDTHGQAIANLTAAGVITGFTDGTFRSGAPVTRAQIASLLDRAVDFEPGTDPGFPDVTAGMTHTEAIANLVYAGVIRGYGDGTFGPGDSATRGQMASMLYRGVGPAVSLKLLATNDFHGRIGSVESPNAAYLSTYLNTIRNRHANTLHVDAGDLVGATPVLSNLFYDEPTVDVMNVMGLDIQTVGNHEFDRGQDEVLRRLEGGCFGGDCDYRGGSGFDGQDFITLSTNVTVDATSEALTEPHAILELGGVNVGFIGVTTENTPQVVHPDGIVGLTFHPEAEAVNDAVPELQADGADVIVVLMHEGGRHDGDANSCENFRGAAATIHAQFDAAVDVVVDGHTHESYVCDVAGGPIITQAYEYGKMFTEITLTYDTDKGEIVERFAVNHTVSDEVTPDPAVVEVIEFYEELAGPALEEVVGHSEVEIPRTTREAESKQGNLATDALLDQYDVDFAFQNSGGLRADLTTLDQDADELYPIRRADVLEVWPFGNIVALAEVDGPLLKEILDNGVYEVGGGRFIQLAGLRIEYSIDATAEGDFPRGVIETVEYWNHRTEADGTPVDLSASATYTIALNDFMAAGGDAYPVLGDAVYSLQDPLEIAVERYLDANSPVNPQIEGRIVDITP